MHGLFSFAVLLALRQLIYPGADFTNQPIPKFERGYLLFLNRNCQLTVYQPSGKLQFTKTLEAPNAMPCFPADSAVDTDGTLAVAIGYSGPLGYAGGIILLDATGKQTSFIDTKLYVPSHIGFDHQHSIWAIGWQHDEIRNETADSNDYAMVRRYSRNGTETGAFVQRSLWKTKGEPAGSSLGYWHMSIAKDRIGALVYDHYAERIPEWIEWDYEGKLISRIPITARMDGGRAYTTSGKLYSGIWLEKEKVRVLSVLDSETGAWKPVADKQHVGEWKLLLGADGDDLVFKSHGGATELVWIRP